MEISILLPNDVLAAIDAIGGRDARSAVIERAVRELLARGREVARLDQQADQTG